MAFFSSITELASNSAGRCSTKGDAFAPSVHLVDLMGEVNSMHFGSRCSLPVNG